MFVGDSKFKTTMPSNVTSIAGLLKYIKSKTKILIAEDEIDRIILEIESTRLSRTILTYIKHVNNLKKHTEYSHKTPPKKVSKILCPKYGSQLILRTVKKGQNKGDKFYGCSAYPKCMFTKSK